MHPEDRYYCIIKLYIGFWSRFQTKYALRHGNTSATAHSALIDLVYNFYGSLEILEYNFQLMTPTHRCVQIYYGNDL